jgi:uncharacterized protein YecT (DUF1311 family)
MTLRQTLIRTALYALFWSYTSLASAQDSIGKYPPVTLSDFPPGDLPTTAQQKAYSSDTSEKYYYGEGVPKDYVKARLIAFAEFSRDGNGFDPFGGASMLMMIYANGYGVKRDLKLSIRLASANVIGAYAAMEGRIAHLRQLQASGQEDVFDVCDDESSTLGLTYCHVLSAELNAQKRDTLLHKLMQPWNHQDSLSYKRLRTTVDNYFELLTENEMDQTGMAHNIETTDMMDTLEADFTKKLQMACSCQADTMATHPASFQRADQMMNHVYSTIMVGPDTLVNNITKSGVKATQIAWIKYKDAWAIFGMHHCPGTTDIYWKAQLTIQRTALLLGLPTANQ